MTISVRRALAVGAVSALLGTGLLTAGAAQATVDPNLSCANPDAVSAAVTAAQTAASDARTAFLHATRQPLGHLLAAERAAAKTDRATARVQIRDLRRQLVQLRKGHSPDAAAAVAELRARIAGLTAQVRRDSRLLDSKRALLAQVKSDRTAARAAWKAAKADLVELRAFADGCATATPTVPGATG